MKINLTEQEAKAIINGIEDHIANLTKDTDLDKHAYSHGYIKAILKDVLMGYMSEETLKSRYLNKTFGILKERLK